eukprot:TRINITY_DN3544_c0_g1_i2.p1 TRINITY_DN3544_c0_g1~~TRINITY_DN3544_c0_g1_i2.p1  ORF type:complete len:444 (-),score=61.91 TRINITY_DN3544_c0_g1_i2:1372-2703(-)
MWNHAQTPSCAQGYDVHFPAPDSCGSNSSGCDSGGGGCDGGTALPRLFYASNTDGSGFAGARRDSDGGNGSGRPALPPVYQNTSPYPPTGGSYYPPPSPAVPPPLMYGQQYQQQQLFNNTPPPTYLPTSPHSSYGPPQLGGYPPSYTPTSGPPFLPMPLQPQYAQSGGGYLPYTPQPPHTPFSNPSVPTYPPSYATPSPSSYNPTTGYVAQFSPPPTSHQPPLSGGFQNPLSPSSAPFNGHMLPTTTSGYGGSIQSPSYSPSSPTIRQQSGWNGAAPSPSNAPTQWTGASNYTPTSNPSLPSYSRWPVPPPTESVWGASIADMYVHTPLMAREASLPPPAEEVFNAEKEIPNLHLLDYKFSQAISFLHQDTADQIRSQFAELAGTTASATTTESSAKVDRARFSSVTGFRDGPLLAFMFGLFGLFLSVSICLSVSLCPSPYPC